MYNNHWLKVRYSVGRGPSSLFKGCTCSSFWMYHDSKDSLDLNDAHMSSIQVPSQSIHIFLAPLRFPPPSRYEVLVAFKAFVIHNVHFHCTHMAQRRFRCTSHLARDPCCFSMPVLAFHMYRSCPFIDSNFVFCTCHIYIYIMHPGAPRECTHSTFDCMSRVHREQLVNVSSA